MESVCAEPGNTSPDKPCVKSHKNVFDILTKERERTLMCNGDVRNKEDSSNESEYYDAVDQLTEKHSQDLNERPTRESEKNCDESSNKTDSGSGKIKKKSRGRPKKNVRSKSLPLMSSPLKGLKGHKGKLSLSPKKGFLSITHFFQRHMLKNSPIKKAASQKQINSKKARRSLLKSEKPKRRKSTPANNENKDSSNVTEDHGKKSYLDSGKNNEKSETVSSSLDLKVDKDLAERSAKRDEEAMETDISTAVKEPTISQTAQQQLDNEDSHNTALGSEKPGPSALEHSGSLSSTQSKKMPKAKKSFKCTQRDFPETSTANKSNSEIKKEKVTTNVASLSNMTFKLKEVETALGIQERSLSKLDSKTLDKIMLEKAQQKKAAKLQMVTSQVPTEMPATIASLPTLSETAEPKRRGKKRKRKHAGTYYLPGTGKKKTGAQSKKKPPIKIRIKPPVCKDTSSESVKEEVGSVLEMQQKNEEEDEEEDLKLSEIKTRGRSTVDGAKIDTAYEDALLENKSSEQSQTKGKAKGQSGSVVRWSSKKRKKYQYKATSKWAKGTVPKIKVGRKIITRVAGSTSKTGGQVKEELSKVYYVMKSPIKTLSEEQDRIQESPKTKNNPVLTSLLRKPPLVKTEPGPPPKRRKLDLDNPFPESKPAPSTPKSPHPHHHSQAFASPGNHSGSPRGRGTSPRGRCGSPRGRGRGGRSTSPRGHRGSPAHGHKDLPASSAGQSQANSGAPVCRKWPPHLTENGFVNTPNGVTYPVTPPYTPEEGSTASVSSDDAASEPQALQQRSIAREADLPPVCSCTVEGVTFTNTQPLTYCQGLDTIDNKTVGCSNKVMGGGSVLHRPSAKVPFLALCPSHRHRLKQHQCCPVCGQFCLQGKFYQCKVVSSKGSTHLHHYHLDCASVVAGQHHCPHCAKPASHETVVLQLNTPRSHTHFKNGFRPSRRPVLRRPCAKMFPTYSGLADVAKDGDKKEVKAVEADCKVEVSLPATGRVISAEGITYEPDKKALEEAINILSGEKPKKLRAAGKCLYAACRSGELDRVLFMLVEGVDPNQKFDSYDGQTALHSACLAGHSHIVHILLQAGAQPNAQDIELRTPLMCASESGYQNIIMSLLKAGAVPELKASDGMTALHLAAKSGRVEAVKTLLQHQQADINVKDDGGWTPVIWAAEHRHLSTVQFLLEMGADPCLKDNEENTGLHWASYSGSVDIAEMFLNAGCDLESPNEHGDRPLHIAARQDHYECVVLFLLRGATADARNNESDTPITVIRDKTCASFMAISVYAKLQQAARNRPSQPLRLLHRDISYGREVNPVAVVNDCDQDNYPTDFLYVSENVETASMNINRTISSLQACSCADDCGSIHCVCGRNSIRCWYTKEGRLVEDFNYSDPPFIFECNKACRCWATCQNRVVQLGITSRLEVFRTVGRGWGCRTVQPITKGTFVCEYIGELISDAEADNREDDSYLFDLDNKDVDTFCVDARRYGNVARFINHLCQPNLIPVKVFIEHQDLRFPRICFFASRDIEAGQELGFDYGDKFWIIKWKQFTCACGSVMCRYSKDTIHKTIEEFNKRIAEEDCASDL